MPEKTGHLTDDESDYLRRLADGEMDVMTMDMPGDEHDLIVRLRAHKLVETGKGMVTITDKGLAALHHVNNPPQRDLWEEWTRWLRSKWWSLPLFALVVLIPLIQSWIQVIQWMSKLFRSDPP